ncbi:MAG: hypothetical protein HW396_586 [Candidatus Dadabacteria bacterium]|nr:hypothetical protein [Candidatus Dadabacteria bacterium]
MNLTVGLGRRMYATMYISKPSLRTYMENSFPTLLSYLLIKTLILKLLDKINTFAKLIAFDLFTIDR